MSPPKTEVRPKARTSSMPRAKPASASFSAKRSAPSISPVRNTSGSNETSPIRSYVSPIKDFTNYTPLRMSREKVSQSYSKIVYKSKTTLNASLSSSSEDIPRLRAKPRASALDSLNDLRSKTEKLDEESKKFAEKVSQIKQKIQKEGRQQPQLATRKPKKDGNLIRNFARTCTKQLSRVCYPALRSALDGMHAKAEKIAGMERQSVRFHAKLRLKSHFSAWKSSFELREIEDFRLTEVACKHYHLQLTLNTFSQWKEATKWSRLRPEDRQRRADISTVLSASAKPALVRPASVSPKPTKAGGRQVPLKNSLKKSTRSPTLSPKPSVTPPPKRGSVTPKPFVHKKTSSSPVGRLETTVEKEEGEMWKVAEEHWRMSAIVRDNAVLQRVEAVESSRPSQSGARPQALSQSPWYARVPQLAGVLCGFMRSQG